MRKLNEHELKQIIKDNLKRLNTLDPREKYKIEFCFKQIEKAEKLLKNIEISDQQTKEHFINNETISHMGRYTRQGA